MNCKGRNQKVTGCDSWIRAFRLCPWSRDVIPLGGGEFMCFESSEDASAFVEEQKRKEEK